MLKQALLETFTDFKDYVNDKIDEHREIMWAVIVWFGSVAMLMGIFTLGYDYPWYEFVGIYSWLIFVVGFGYAAFCNVFYDDSDDPEQNSKHICWYTSLSKIIFTIVLVWIINLVGVLMIGPLYWIGWMGA